MSGIADLQQDQEFQALSPEARGIVLDRMGSDDAEFSALSSEAQSIVKSRLGGVSDKADLPHITIPKAPPPLAPYLADQAKIGLSGTASLPALLGDTLVSPLRLGQHALSKATDKVPAPDYTGFSKAMYGYTAGQLGVKNIPTPPNEYGKPSKSNEYLGALARFAGASVVPGLGVVSAAERPLLAALVETAATTISAMSSVEGGEFGRTIATKLGLDPERGQKFGEVLGSLAGPATIATGVSAAEKAAVHGTRKASEMTGITGVGKESQVRAGQVAASKDLGIALKAGGEQTARSLEEASVLQKDIPGYKPTLGQASGAPGVIAIENKIAGGSPEGLARAGAREAENQAVISGFRTDKFPPSTTAATAPVKTFYTAKAAQQQKSLANVETQIKTLAGKNQFQDNAAIGSQLRVLREKQRDIVKNVKNNKYNDTYDAAERAGIKENVDDVQALMLEVAGSDANAAATMPQVYGILKGAIKKYAPAKPEAPRILVGGKPQAAPQAPPTEVPFAALHSMKKAAGADRSAALAAGDTSKAYLIGKVDDLLTAKLKRFEGEEFGEVSAKLQDANEFFKTKYQPVFQEGLGGRMGPLAKGKFGEVTQDSDIVRKLIFNPENKRGTQEFFEIFGNDAEAQSLLRNGVHDMFAKAVVRDGSIKPALVETFVRQHDAQLKMLPSLKNELRNIDEMNDVLLARRETLQSQQARFEKTTVAKIAKTEDAQEVINKALTDRKTMLALVSQARKTPEGGQALAGAIAKTVAEQKNPMEFLLAHQETLRPALAALGKDHFNNVVTLARAETQMARVKTPTHVELTKLEDIGQRTVGTSVPGIFSRIRGALMRFQSPGYIVIDFAGRYIYKIKTAEANKLMELAIYDPELAQALINMPKQSPQIAINSLRNYAFSHGIRVLAVAKGKEQDSQTPSGRVEQIPQ